MEVRSNNLYRTGKIIQFDDESRVLVRTPISKSQIKTFEYHTVKALDEITAIAFRYYSKYEKDSSKLWWAITDVNEIFNPFDLSSLIGEQLAIPSIKEVKALLK